MISTPALCLHNAKHALTGQFSLLLSESQECFDELRDALRAEHAPATATEIILVDRLAEHVWLSQRAQNMQDEAAAQGKDSWFAMMLRYQTIHDRAFHKCLAELRTLRRERNQVRKQNPKQREGQEPIPAQFESQNAEAAVADSSPARQYTAEELDRLSPGEISALVQASLKRANLTLDDFCDEEELRIANTRSPEWSL